MRPKLIAAAARPCPSCGSSLSLITDGMVGDVYAPAVEYINGASQRELVIKWRLAAFVACNMCEFCEEVR